MSIKQYVQRFLKALNHTRRTPRAKRIPRQLFLECLEDRTVPSILFGTTSGKSIVSGTGPVIANAHVDLIFWGAGWNSGVGPALRNSMQTAVDSIQAGSYMDGLAQYRSIAHAARTRSDTIISSSPPSVFSNTDVFNMLVANIANSTLPSPDGDSQLLYMVIPQPGSLTGTSTNGLHTDIDYGSGHNRAHYGWTLNNGSLDTLTNIYSHELAEAVTDPEGTGILVTPPDAGTTGWFEIGDGAAQNYVYRLNGYLVQSYYSQATSSYDVYTRQTQDFIVSGGNPRQILVNGNQLASHNDTISVDVSSRNGVRVTLNGEVAEFEPDSRINLMAINTGDGIDTVNVLRTLAGVPVSISNGDAGTGSFCFVNLGSGGSAQGIQGAVTINTRATNTFLTIDDSADGFAHGAVTLSDATPIFGQITGLVPATVSYYYGGTFEVTLKTGTASNTINVLATGGHDVQLEGHSNSTAVNIGDAGHLSNIRAYVVITNPPAHTSLNVDGSNDPGSHTVTIDQVSTLLPDYGTIAGLAPNVIEYKYANTAGVTVKTGTGSNTVNVVEAVRPLSLTVRGTDTVNVQSTAAALTVNLGTGTDTVNLSSSSHNLDTIRGGVTVQGGGGVSTLNVFDDNKFLFAPSDPFGRYSISNTTVQRTSPVAALITYHAVTNLLVKMGADVRGTPMSISITGTAAGTQTTVTTATAPPGINIISVGDATSKLDAIQGPLSVVGTSSSLNVLSVDDRGTAPGRTYYITGNNIDRSGAATIAYQGVAQLGLACHFGDGGNQVNVLGTSSIASTGIDAGKGGDTVNVRATAGSLTVTLQNSANTVNVGSTDNSLDPIQGAIVLNGPSQGAALNLNDQGTGISKAFTLTANTIDRTGTARITYSNVTSLTVNSGSGGATVTVLSISATPTLAGNAAGINTLIGQNTNTTWRITGIDAGTLTGGTNAAAFTNFQNLRGSGADDTFIFSDGATLSGTADGGGGSNTIDSSAYTTDERFSITGTDAGGGTPVAVFVNVQSVIAGAGNNAFSFSDGGSLGGALNGGAGGTNTLDYSAYTTNVIVNLQTASATGVGGSILNNSIRNVTGGNGGPAGSYNILVGNGGNVLTGGNGRRNLLIAGAASSTLLGGDGEDILIGGTTAYDTDAASLQAIMDYWAGTDDYGTRVANLTSGTGVPLLDATMVTGNGGGNTLNGGPGLDLFYGDLALNTYDWDPATETFVSV
jgi:hypothetical protein